ncbi:hypothetical protein CYLTODRAFT_427610, partial [Cylindrobasidium torrendii FP15055 ss-10]
CVSSTVPTVPAPSAATADTVGPRITGKPVFPLGWAKRPPLQVNILRYLYNRHDVNGQNVVDIAISAGLPLGDQAAANKTWLSTALNALVDDGLIVMTTDNLAFRLG